LPWLEHNAETLGFETRRTASRLMDIASDGTLASHLDEASAVTASRKLWGHKDSQLVQQSLSNEHYTPAQYLGAARDVLGAIDLDPRRATQPARA
jgi:hypothetical protein